MEKLEIKLENCYGIGKLEYVFDFSISNSHMIYAPNGTMKTSFARTFNDISKNDKKISPCDRIYQNRKTISELKVDGSPINYETILVVDAEDSTFDATKKISNFIASKELKKKYDAIYYELDLQKREFIKKLKSISQSTDCESEFTNTFTTELNSFYESLEKIIEILDDKYVKYKFRYNDIFDKKGNVKKFLEKNQHLLNQYINNYQELLSKSSFFKKSDNSFGTYQASEILKSIEDNSYFEAGHKFLLDGNIDIDSADKLKQLVENEVSRIINDESLKEIFDRVDKAIGANFELRAFKKVIEKDNLLLIELEKYDDFREKVWISYISDLKNDALELSKFYNTKKKDLEEILKEARKEFKIWENIISKFNSRFYVPFNVLLTNQEDIILKEETANLEFQYLDKNEEPVNQSKENLLKILGKGEQRAYYILQLLFDIESRKGNPNNLIIFDDIADSFDYKNKYAIIEYIKDLHLLNNFKIIILTHNFDFYRTVSSRLFLGDAVHMVSKNDDRTITLSKGQYRNDVLKYFLSKLGDPKIFISLIAFARNIVEYTEEDSSDNYRKLTNCLHFKPNSANTKANDILEIYMSKFSVCNGRSITFGEKNIIELIIETADSIIAETDINEILLENKVALSIAIRLKAEKYMIKELPSINLDSIKTNQTNLLFTKLSKIKSGQEVEILDKVNLMTPENIHMNAFMYEPLIDISLNHLKELYSKVCSLNQT